MALATGRRAKPVAAAPSRIGVRKGAAKMPQATAISSADAPRPTASRASRAAAGTMMARVATGGPRTGAGSFWRSAPAFGPAPAATELAAARMMATVGRCGIRTDARGHAGRRCGKLLPDRSPARRIDLAADCALSRTEHETGPAPCRLAPRIGSPTGRRSGQDAGTAVSSSACADVSCRATSSSLKSCRPPLGK